MAALQSIRSKGPLLMGFIGLALFAFIAGDYFKVFDVFSNDNRQTIGEVYGKKLKFEEYQAQLDELTQMQEFAKQMQTQNPQATLTEQEKSQLGQQVWTDFVRNTTIEHEAEKAGLEVTEEDVQNTLRTGQASSLQVLAQIFPSQQGGLDVAGFQKFIKEYDSNMANMRKQAQQQPGMAEYIEQYQKIRKLCDYSLEKLHEEVLANKFYSLLGASVIANKEIAKVEYNFRNTQSEADVVAIPLSSIPDSQIKIADADLKKAYDQYKESPIIKNPARSADLQVLDIQVKASATDRAALEKEMQTAQQQLQNGADPATVVSSANSSVHYVNAALGKNAFAQMSDVQQKLDSMSVGQVKPMYYNPQDNTLNVLKLIAKTQAPDSILYRAIGVANADKAKETATADSIYKALQGGAKFKDLAKRYQQQGDSSWIVASQAENLNMQADDATFITQLSSGPGLKLVKLSQYTMIVEVLQSKKPETKYNVAIVKRTLDFSKKTHNDELNKLNMFLAKNRDLDSFIKNAGKAGYILRPMDAYSQSNLQIQSQIGGEGAKDAMQWVFDNAKAGQISKLYECGANNDHLLVIGVSAINDGDYLPLENKTVKDFLTRVVRQQKKAEMILAQTKNVKNINDAKKQKGAINEQLHNIALLGQPAQLQALGVSEPRLTGAIYRTAKGQFTGAVQGEGAVYFAQVTNKVRGAEQFNLQQQQQQIVQRIFSSIVTQNYFGGAQEVLLATLVQEQGHIKDNLYRFFRF